MRLQRALSTVLLLMRIGPTFGLLYNQFSCFSSSGEEAKMGQIVLCATSQTAVGLLDKRGIQSTFLQRQMSKYTLTLN